MERSAVATSPTTPSEPGLAREAIGLREVFFQSVTHMAPAAAVAFSIVVGANFASGALPLSVIFALIGCLLVAISIGQLAKHLPSAGGFYTYTAKGIHPAVGFLVAWGYAFVEPLVAPALYLIFGQVVAATLAAEFGWSFSQWWWIAAIAAAVIVFLLGYFGIQISTRVGTILGLFEIGVFAALAVWLIVEAGGDNDLSVFGTSFATVEGFDGLSGVIAGSVYTILAFIGFEAAAPLAEETKDPRRTIGRAVIYSCIGIGLFYVLTTYAATVFFGPDRFFEFPASGQGNPWDALARAAWGAGWVLVFLAIANSAIANSNAGSNAATRTWFAMGRIRLLPAMLGRTHPKYRSPHVAVWTQFVIGVGVALWLGAQYNSPFTAFAMLGTIIGAVVIAIYMTVNLACLLYYARFQKGDFNVLLHVVVPILGIVAFVPAFLVAIGVGGSIFDFISPLPYPFSVVGPVVGIWYLIGVVYLVYLYARKPERVKDTARVFIEEEVAEASAPI
ncbi:MAG TPA: APC family permease [Actinomycetota bacterium]|nr:APC family permease [Actinomycetota bacterium]